MKTIYFKKFNKRIYFPKLNLSNPDFLFWIFGSKSTLKPTLSSSDFVDIHYCPEAEFYEFEPRLKFETRFKYGWFHLKLYSMFQDLSWRSTKTGFWQIWDAAQIH